MRGRALSQNWLEAPAAALFVDRRGLARREAWSLAEGMLMSHTSPSHSHPSQVHRTPGLNRSTRAMAGLGVSTARRVRALPALAVLLFLLGLGACGGSGAEPVAPKTVVVTLTAGSASASSGMPGASSAATSAGGGPSARASTGSTSGGSGGASPAASAAPPRPGPAAGGPTIEVGSKDSAAFASPSGNIVCELRRGEETAHTSVRCDVVEHAWTLPPRPADCEYEWGNGVLLVRGSAYLGCASDTALYAAVVDSPSAWWLGRPGSQRITVDSRGAMAALAYGASLRLGTVTCLSATDGVHCTDATTGHGFDIAKATYRLR